MEELNAVLLWFICYLKVNAALIVFLFVGAQEEVEGDDVGKGNILRQACDTFIFERIKQLSVEVTNLILADRHHWVNGVEPRVNPLIRSKLCQTFLLLLLTSKVLNGFNKVRSTGETIKVLVTEVVFECF